MNTTIIEKIKERLAKCQEEHKSCPSKVLPVLPKRLIDVGAGESDRSIALYISEPNEKASYVALSYCWGGPQRVMTTSSTLESFKSALPTELPRSIQDAILVTRSLGFRYLWVDVLCIIQDDDSDKTTEISDMGLIYKKSTLTIAAASASSVQDGFLKDRPPLPMCQLPFYVTDNSSGSIWLRLPDHERPNEPLDSRAWTLQESLLSPRILYYATKDLIWKCQGEKFVAVNETHNPYFTSSTERLPDAVFQTSQNSSGTELRTRTWDEIVEDYSGRKLTVPEDRLPALAGLARELQAVWNDGYFAGMWRSCLVKQLAWSPLVFFQRQPLTAYQSPGWSWVSIEGQVMIQEVQREVAELLDVSVNLVDKSSPFGQICGGKLVLRAPMLPGSVEMNIEYPSMNFTPDGKRVLDNDCTFLLLGYLAKSQTIGLILRPTEDGTFMRVGCFTSGHQHGKSIPWPAGTAKRETVTII